MEFTNEAKEAVRKAANSVIARFTNGVTVISIQEHKKYLSLETNDIPMTPRLFKRLYIRGTISPTNKGLGVWLDWAWETFDGGSNGTCLCRFSLTKSSNGEGYWIDKIFF